MANAAVGTKPSSFREHNPRSLPSSAVADRAPSHTSLRLPSSAPRRGLIASAFLVGGAGIALAAAASACAFPLADAAAGAAGGLLPDQLTPSLSLQEPGNALSLPTWAIHVASVVEWVTAMALVWEYGDKSGLESWKGLSWGMLLVVSEWRGQVVRNVLIYRRILKSKRLVHPLAVSSAFMQVPLLGGALCACTWHFFYNSESLDILVALQAALTVVGNLTMCIAAFRIYKSSQRESEKS